MTQAVNKAPTPDAIAHATRVLGGVCDGAHARDGQGYNGVDSGWMRMMALQKRHTPRQLRVMHKILRKYAGQLSQHGINYEDLVPPSEDARPSIPKANTVKLEWVKEELGVAVLFAYDEVLIEVMRRQRKRWFRELDDGRKAWLIPAEMDHVEEALTAIRAARPSINIEVSKDLSAALVERQEELDRAYKESRNEESDLEVPTKIPLRPFQKAGVKWIRDRKGRAILGDDMGVGKTCQVIGYLALEPEALPALIVCPANVRANWVQEIRKFSDLSALLVVTKGSVAGFKKLGFAARVGPVPGYDVTIVNYDLFRADYDKKAKQLRSATIAGIPLEEWKGFKTVVFDESHYIKEHTAQRTRAALALANPKKVRGGIKDWGTERVIALTGTPLVNRPKDLWTQLRAVDWDLFPNFMHYAKRYCDAKQIPAGRRLVWDFSGASHLDELEKKLRSSVMMRRTKEQVLHELPAKTRTTIPIVVNPDDYEKDVAELHAQLQKDKEKRDEWRALLEGMEPKERKAYLSKHAAAAAEAAKLTGQMVKKIDGIKQAAVWAKFNEAMKFILDAQDQNGKLLVFASHHATIDAIVSRCRKAKLRVDHIDGRVVGANREKVKTSFQEGDLQVLVAGIRATAEGLTLTASHTVIFMEFDWTPSKHQQAEDRVYRIGQKSAVTIYYLMAVGTIEEHVAAIVDAKREVSNVALGEEERTLEEAGILDSLVERLCG